MSRVDDDRQAQRVAEQAALKKRLEEQKAKERAPGESAFSRLLQKAQPKDARAPAEAAPHPDAAGAEEPGLGDAELLHSTAGRAAPQRPAAGKGAPSFGEVLQAATPQARAQDARSTERRTESRREDARAAGEAHSERGEALARGAVSGSAAHRAKGEARADADGGGKGSGSDRRDEREPAAAPGFRFNPALMAPVPVAKAKDAAASERLRAVASEIAQKIVERVRVGTNAAGASEFQIDLRSTVLAGLSIRISGGNGKIRASFTGSDREVLKLLRENADALAQALRKRGLALEECTVEERA